MSTGGTTNKKPQLVKIKLVEVFSFSFWGAVKLVTKSLSQYLGFVK